MPSVDVQVEALAIAFVELAKFLDRNSTVPITQLARALENAAKASTTSAQAGVALGELARKLRP